MLKSKDKGSTERLAMRCLGLDVAAQRSVARMLIAVLADTQERHSLTRKSNVLDELNGPTTKKSLSPFGHTIIMKLSNSKDVSV